VASLYKKVISGKPYWYLREMAWVEGKPKLASERYLGTAAEIAALLASREAAMVPERTRHLAFGDAAAVWGMLQRLDVPGVIDSVVGPRRSDAGASVGTYLALAALNRVVAPCSKLAFADWWRTTAADRFTKIPARVLDHRKFWEAMHAVSAKQLAEIEQRLAVRIVAEFGVDIGSLALDMTNFATFIDSANDKAPIAQRGKAKRAPICGWSGWAWWSPATAASRWSATPIRATSPTSPSSPPCSASWPPGTPPSPSPPAWMHRRRSRWCSTPVRTRRPTSTTWPRSSCTTSARCRPRTCPTCSRCPKDGAGSSTPTDSVA
jgi:hypothetical protein